MSTTGHRSTTGYKVMKKESRKQRLTNLMKLAKVFNVWHVVYGIIFITFLPYLTIGTAIHEPVVIFSRFGTLGILIAPFYVKLMRLILAWYAKTGRSLESPTFVPMLLMGALTGTLISYVILRIFKHEGNWESTLVVSYDDAIISLFSNLLLAFSVGFCTLILTYYREGENVIMRHKQPTPFWKVAITLISVPFLFMCVALVIYLAK